MVQIWFSEKWCIPVVQQRTDNREQMPQVQFQNVKQKQIQRVQKKIEIPQSQLVQETMRSEIGPHDAGKDFRRAGYLSVRLLSGLSSKQPELRASNVSSMRFKIPSLSLRSSRQWRCRRMPNLAEVKETSRAKLIWCHEDQQDWDDVEQQLSVQDPGAQTQPKQLTRHHRSVRCHEQGIDQQAYLPQCEHQRSGRLQQIRS